MNDEEMLAALAMDLDGNFEALVRQYQDRLYRFALRLAGSPADAEEIAQDAFVRAYRALRRSDAAQIQALALRPWLYQISLNVFRNSVRKRRVPVVDLDGYDQEDGAQDLPEQVAEARETQRALARLVATLPPRYRTAVVLRYVEELGYGEIGAILGQAEGTVKSHVHRGLAMLRQAVENPDSEVRR